MLRTSSLALALLVFLLAAPGPAAVFETFEGDGFGEWKVEGTAFGDAPTHGGPPDLGGRAGGFADDAFACSHHGGDKATGFLLSPPFTIENNYIAFLVAGGDHPGETAIELLLDGKVVRTASGKNTDVLARSTWNVSDLRGKTARIRILDRRSGSWGYISVDHILFTNHANSRFPRPTRDGQPLEGNLVSSEDIKGLLIPEGVRARVFADYKSHQVYSPTALCIDEQGRVLVTETHRFGSSEKNAGVYDNRRHLYWLHDDLAAQTVADRLALHEKWQEKVPLSDSTTISEIVRLLADTDGDGRADQSQVFAEDFKDLVDGPAAGIFSYQGTTYLGCIPHIWALRDTNGDGVAEERKSLQDGFGVRVSFSGHDLNGFALGPDGRLYGTIGDRGFNLTTREGRRYSYPDQGAIFRFDPDGSNFEVLHTGLRNPKEIAFDKWGNGVSVDNNSDQSDEARVIHLMDGADSGWHMGHQVLHSFHTTVGIPQRSLNSWMAEGMWKPARTGQPAWFLPPVANLTSGPSGLAYQPGTGFARGCKDRFLICDYRGSGASSGIWSFGVQEEGAGLKVVAPAKFNWGATATDVEFGYDGRLYVADFREGWKSHADGRIYTLSSGEERDALSRNVEALISAGFAHRESAELARLMDHPDLRVRTRAHLALADKKDAHQVLSSIARSSASPLHRLHAVWGLWKLTRTARDAESSATLAGFLTDEDAEIRAQAARALGEAALGDPAPLRAALRDDSLRVRAFAALSLARQKDQGAWHQVLTLLAENDDRDPALRHAGVMALLGCGTADQIAALHKDPRPAVRLAAVVALRRLAHPGLIPFLQDSDPRIADEAIRAIHDVPVEEGRPNLSRLLDDYAPGKNGRTLTRLQMRRLLYSAFRFGTPASARRLLRAVQNPSLDMAERREALRLLALWTDPPPVDHSTGNFLPLAPRDPSDLVGALEDELPRILQLDDQLIAPAIFLFNKYQLSIDLLDTPTLQRLFTSDKRTSDVRKQALDLYVARQPADLAEKLIAVARVGNDEVAAHALQHLVKIDPVGSLPAVRSSLYRGEIGRQQQAWRILAGIDGPQAARAILGGLTKLKAGEIRMNLTLDIIEAAEARKEPEVVASLAEYRASLPKDDPLAEYTSTFYGGDPDEGAKVFHSHAAAQCSRCHRVTKGHSPGGEIGPNLFGIGRLKSTRHFVESLVNPSAKLTPGYGITTFTFTNGGTLTGNLLAEGEDYYDLSIAPDLWRIKKSDVAELTAPVSAMPPMGALLSKREIRDLSAWLANQRDKIPEERAVPEPQDFDPASLIAKPKEASPQKDEPKKAEVEAQPAPKASPAPEPKAKPESTPAPTPAAKPEPTPQATPEPEPIPQADPEPKPAPKSATPAPEPEPAPAPTVEPSSEGSLSVKVVVWSAIVLGWIGICLVPVLFGLTNR